MTATHTDSIRPVSEGPPFGSPVLGSPSYGKLLRGILLLLGVLLAVSLLVMPVMVLAAVPNGIVSALAALALCFVCGSASIAVMEIFCQQSNGPIGILLAMAVRMFPPLAVCLALAVGVPSLETGSFDSLPFVGSLLVYYLAMLAVDIWLATQSIHQSQQAVESK